MKMEDSMSLDPTTNRLTLSYPWKACKSRMTSNKGQALKVQKKIEDRLQKDG